MNEEFTKLLGYAEVAHKAARRVIEQTSSESVKTLAGKIAIAAEDLRDYLSGEFGKTNRGD